MRARESGASRKAAIEATKNVFRIVYSRRSKDFVEDDVLSLIQIFRGDESSIAVCRRCSVSYCFQCLDDRFARNVANAFLSGIALAKDGILGPTHYLCPSCYWAAKPCSNPTCPNEVGVPTKRCGGCHLDRYCSVECQAAAYPAHVGRCQKIQEKRTTAGKGNGY